MPPAVPRLAVAAVMFLVAGALPAPANVMKPATAAIPYARLAALRDGFDAIAPGARDHVAVAIIVGHEDTANHGPIRLWVEDPSGAVTAIGVSSAGVVDLPNRPDWLSRQLMVRSDQPAGSLHLDAGLTIQIPTGRTLSTAYLRTGLAQSQAALRSGARRMGGYLAQFLVPRFRSIRILLAGCCTGTAILSPGGTVLYQDEWGYIGLSANSLVSATMVAVSAPVRSIDPSQDP